MMCKYFSILLCILWMSDECGAKYLISPSDSVNVQNCDLESIRNISQLNPNPEEIIIHSCYVDVLPNALFIRFQRLRQLEITESQLQTISDFAFNGLSALQLLNLSRNNLTSVKTWSDSNLPSLQGLDLRRNVISEIHKDAFKYYTGLLKLNLAVNHIDEIPDELFRTIPLLKLLNLAKNNLKSIESHTFKHLHKLLHLELKHNQIEFIHPESFVGLTHLRTLHLQENRLTMFHHELITNLPRLHHLNLSNNFIEDFADETFAKSEELISLDISHNKFESFSKLTFKGLEVLEVLNVSHNEIEDVEHENFMDLTNLVHLDLSANQITHISDGTFGTMNRLKSIKMNNNSLRSIDEAVFTELKLKRLDLSCNRLSDDNFLWASSVEIEHLNLTFNDFRSINISVVANVVTDFWGNPFSCDWLVKEALTSKNIRLGRNSYVVSSKHDILKVAGIECFDQHGGNVQKLIVVEASKDEMSGEVENHLERLQMSVHNSAPQLTTATTENYDYRTSLLWLSFGCITVFAGLKLLKCLLTKSEKQSEVYRLSRQQQEVLSINEEFKSSIDMK